MALNFPMPPKPEPAYVQLDKLTIVLPPKPLSPDEHEPTREDSITYLRSIRDAFEDWEVDQRHREALANWHENRNAAMPRIELRLDGLDEVPEQLAEAGMFPVGQLEAEDRRVELENIARVRGITVEDAAARWADAEAGRMKWLDVQVAWPSHPRRAHERQTRCPSCGRIDALVYATDRVAAKCVNGCTPQQLTDAITRFVVWSELEDVRSVTERQRDKLRATVSLRQAFTDTPAAEPQLIDGVLPAGALVMLHAPSGGRKTMTSISWLVAVAAGRPWLGRATRQVNALAILLEGARIEHVRWIRQLAAGMGVSLDELEGRLDLYREDFKADDPASLADVAQRIKACEHRLVVIDNLSQIHSGGHGAENDARAMHAVLHPLEQLVRSVPGLTVVVLHHANAAGDPRGRDGIKQHFDRSLNLEASSDRNSAVITLNGDGKHRDGVELDEDPRWRFVGGPADAALTMSPIGTRRAEPSTEAPEDPRHTKLLALLPATSSEIYAGMGGNRNTVKQLRDALEAEGLITEQDGRWIRVVE